MTGVLSSDLLSVCVFSNPPVVSPCVATFNCTFTEKPGLAVEVFEIIFPSKTYQYILSNYSSKQLEYDYSSILSDSDQPCDTFVEATYSTTNSSSVSQLSPHYQHRTLIAIPLLEPTLYESLSKFFIIFSAELWILWIVFSISLVFIINLYKKRGHSILDWTLIRSLVPGQCTSLTAPDAKRDDKLNNSVGLHSAKLIYVFFTFFIGQMAQTLYGNCLVVYMQNQAQPDRVQSFGHFIELVSSGELSLIDTYDWADQYDRDTNYMTARLRAALDRNPILIVQNMSAVVEMMKMSTGYVYLHYELQLLYLWDNHNLCDIHKWQMLDVSALEAGGWYAYQVRASARSDIELLNTRISYFSTLIIRKMDQYLKHYEMHCNKAPPVQAINYNHVKGVLCILFMGLTLASFAHFCELLTRFL